jgi:hypothetical protein
MVTRLVLLYYGQGWKLAGARGLQNYHGLCICPTPGAFEALKISGLPGFQSGSKNLELMETCGLHKNFPQFQPMTIFYNPEHFELLFLTGRDPEEQAATLLSCTTGEHNH